VAARAADPAATLLVNDFDLSPAYERLIEDCLDAGIAFDAIGLQTHMHQGYRGEAWTLGVLERFASDACGCIERMRRHARNGDTASLASEAHRLKGSSGTVGAILLAGACQEIERSARAGICTGMELRLEQARDALDATRVGLIAYFRGTIPAAA